jgi:hypothetical protein
MLRLELRPSLVAVIESRKALDIDVPGLELVAVLFLDLVEDEIELADEILIDDDDARVLEIDVAGDDLDARVERLLHDVAHRLGLAAIDDDAFDPEVDRLTDLFAFLVRALPPLEHMEVDAKRLRLARYARFVSLKEVAARQIADEGNLDVSFVKRWRSAG